MNTTRYGDYRDVLRGKGRVDPNNGKPVWPLSFLDRPALAPQRAVQAARWEEEGRG